MEKRSEFEGTTVVAVRKDNKTAVAGDGQVSLGNSIIKKGARKVRKIYNDKVIVGFAGSTADAMTLFERLENKLQEFRGNLKRAAVELAKDWRTDRMLRRLEALMVVADAESLFLLSGAGDVIEPDDGLIAIGSGGGYALAAAKALLLHSASDAREIALESLHIASQICVYTNNEIIVEEIEH